MKNRLTRLLLILCALGLLLPGGGTAESAGASREVAVEIVKLTVGPDAVLGFANRGEKEITTVCFRIRGFSGKGTAVYTSGADIGPDGRVLMNMSLYEAPVTPVFAPGDSREISLTSGYQAIFSSVLEAAVQQYTTADGETFRVPESQLSWFSSEGGYTGDQPPMFQYDYPDGSIFRKSYSFSLGVSVERVFPELIEAYGVTKTGYLITSTHGGILEGMDVQAWDLIWAINGLAIEDDPCALEKAKAALTEGTEMTLSLLRNNEPLDVTVTPDDLIRFRNQSGH